MARKDKLSQPERQAKVRKLWANGLSCTQIAERLGFSRVTIMHDISQLGLANKKHPRWRYESPITGGHGRGGFAGAMAKRT